MECAQVTEEQRLWTETQIQKAKHNAWPSSLASVYLTHDTMVAILLSTTLGHCGARATYQPTNTLSHPSSQLIPSHSLLRLTCGTSGPGDQRSHQRDDHGPAPHHPAAFTAAKLVCCVP